MLFGVSSPVLAMIPVSNAPPRVDIDRFRALLAAHCGVFSRGGWKERRCSRVVREATAGTHVSRTRSS